MPPKPVQLAVIGGELVLPTSTAVGRIHSGSPGTASTRYEEELRAAAGLIQEEANIHIQENMKIPRTRIGCQGHARHRARLSDE